MKKRFTATVALMTLLSSSTVPTLTQAAEQVKVSQTTPDTNETNSTDTTTADTTKARSVEKADTTKDSQTTTTSSKKASTDSSKTQSSTTVTPRSAMVNAIRKAENAIKNLGFLEDKQTYIHKIDVSNDVAEVNAVLAEAQKANTTKATTAKNNAKNTINNDNYLTPAQKSAFKSKIDGASNSAAIQTILTNAKTQSADNKKEAEEEKRKAADKKAAEEAKKDPNKDKKPKGSKGKQQPQQEASKGSKGKQQPKKPVAPTEPKGKQQLQKGDANDQKAKKQTKTLSHQPKPKYKKSNTSKSTVQRQAMAAAAIAKLDDELQIGADENPIKISPNMTGKEFIEAIADYASEVAEKNDLYASVMIAQACLESGFGTSGLSSSPYYNFFGIKGAYKGRSVNMQTLEDGSNGLYSINAGFRDYPSPKESLEDYAKLLSTNFYKGAHKSKTASYRDATRFLTGRYATDRNYARKLNGIIEAYDLTQYDEGNGKVKRIKKITNVYYTVKHGDTIKKIAKAHHNSVKELKEWNKKKLKDVNLIYPGQKIIADQKVTYKYIKLKDTDDDKLKATKGKFNLPLKKGSYTVTSPFGGRKAPNAAAGNYHEGIDLAVPMNSNVYAAREGVVFATGYDGSAGNYVFIYHGKGLFSNYFHLTRSTVKVGDRVDAGDLIAKSGSTGNSTGPHLHFGISHRLWGDYENPEDYVNFR